MPASVPRPLALAVLFAAVLAAAGCGSSGTPNPDLKVPEVPAGDRASGGAAKDPKAKN